MTDGDQATDGPRASASISRGDLAKTGCGCLTFVLLLVGWIGWKLLTRPDYDAIARTQTSAMTLSVFEESDGQQMLTDLILEYPPAQREEHARQLVDLWFNTDSPIMFPTPGVDADWLERDSSRQIVKRKMVDELMRGVAAKQGQD